MRRAGIAAPKCRWLSAYAAGHPRELVGCRWHALQQCLTVHRAGHGEPVGTISPHFIVPENTDLEPVRLRWIPVLTGGNVLPAVTTWRAGARALAAAITEVPSHDSPKESQA